MCVSNAFGDESCAHPYDGLDLGICLFILFRCVVGKEKGVRQSDIKTHLKPLVSSLDVKALSNNKQLLASRLQQLKKDGLVLNGKCAPADFYWRPSELLLKKGLAFCLKRVVGFSIGPTVLEPDTGTCSDE